MDIQLIVKKDMDNSKLGKFEILYSDLKINTLLFEKNDDVVFVNFGIDSSIKIAPFFEKIQKRELNDLLEVFKNVKVNLRLCDITGMVHIVLLKLLKDIAEEQILVVGDTGFGKESIKFLEKNFKCLMEKEFKNKSIFIYSENLACGKRIKFG